MPDGFFQFACRAVHTTANLLVFAVDARTNWIGRDVRSLGEWHYNRCQERSQAAAKPSSNTQPRDGGQHPELCRTGNGSASFGDRRMIISAPPHHCSSQQDKETIGQGVSFVASHFPYATMVVRDGRQCRKLRHGDLWKIWMGRTLGLLLRRDLGGDRPS